MRNIIIVECISTGINYIEDILNRGYNPIVLHIKSPDTDKGHEFDQHMYDEYKRIDYDFDMIFEQDSYEDTLEEVKKFNPLLVLPGSEGGVVLSHRLSHDLGLLSNPIENIDAMTLKNEMHNRLKGCGLRYIRGKLIHSLEEALDFYDSEGLKEVVLKPIYSAGSASVRICLNRDDLIDSAKILFGGYSRYGSKNNELLIQERIDGVEYIVNTVSHKGIHRVTLVWKYNKIRTSEGAIIYDSAVTVNELSLGEAELIEYAYSVADAMGIQYGPVHGEYMLDENGPVLIEVNCRPCGGDMPAEYLDMISGQHETDSALDSYLKPERFFEELKKKYELYAYEALKLFIVPRDIIAHSSPMMNIGANLESFFSGNIREITADSLFFPKTSDLSTSGGHLFLVNKDKPTLDKNLEFLRKVEKSAFSLILSEDSQEIEIKDDDVYLNEIKPLIEESEKYGTGLFVTDQFLESNDILQVNPNNIADVKGKFEFIIINLNKSLMEIRDDEKGRLFLDIFAKLRTGGIIFIPKNTYQFMTNERKGMEALLEVLNYKIELPPYNIKEIIIASKTK